MNRWHPLLPDESEPSQVEIDGLVNQETSAWFAVKYGLMHTLVLADMGINASAEFMDLISTESSTNTMNMIL